MNPYRPRGIIAALLMAASSLASAGATVTYADFAKMIDVPRDQSDRESMQADLLEHFNTLAARLPAGQELKVEILNMDLAGDVFPRVAIRDVRVFKGRADWPRIELRYSIEQDGKVLRSGHSEVSDPNYMMGINRYSNDVYRYEKKLLDAWFRKEIDPPKVK